MLHHRPDPRAQDQLFAEAHRALRYSGDFSSSGTAGCDARHDRPFSRDGHSYIVQERSVLTTLVVRDADLASTAADAIVVGVAQGGGNGGDLVLGPGAAAVDQAIPGGLLAALSSLRATGALDEVSRFPTLGALPATTVVAVGLGPVADDGRYDAEVLRRAAGSALRTLAGSATVLIGLATVDGDDDAASAGRVRAIAEGALLGSYTFNRFRSHDTRPDPVGDVIVAAPASDANTAAVRLATVVAQATALCRDLVNTPASHLHPADLARVAKTTCTPLGLRVDVLDEVALAEGGYGGLLGVGSGSAHPPRLVRIAYSTGAGDPAIHLVGKGITFDSGGLSLKPNDGMITMKCDMAGAAAVLACLSAIAQLKPDINVVGWLAIAENMPSGTAGRPSDVITIHDGRTVEVLNTDAEGRLVLADGIARACEEQPAMVVDVATLTGAQMVALGARTSAVMGNDQALIDQILAAAGGVGEGLWPMPLPEYLRKELRSEIADLKNIGNGRWGGMLTAALFLREFVADGVPWAHLDIAGAAFNSSEAWGYTPVGGTGAMVRTFVELVDRAAAARTVS
jgi:leucyl aminopeptidase